jgi:hypothetical protein
MASSPASVAATTVDGSAITVEACAFEEVGTVAGHCGEDAMATRRWVIAELCVVLVAIGTAAPVSAATRNLLGGHGNFERPVVGGFFRSFGPGQIDAAKVVDVGV